MVRVKTKTKKKKSPSSTKARARAAARPSRAKKTKTKGAGARKAGARAPASRKATAKPKRLAKKPTRKVAAAVKVAARPLVKAMPKNVLPERRRRDATGHLRPEYAADLHERSRESAEPAEPSSFVKGNRSGDVLAEELGEEFVKTAVSGEDTNEDAMNQIVPEEGGGPFVETTAGVEFAEGTDESNPIGARKEPFPTT
jgi:hypothetical protein